METLLENVQKQYERFPYPHYPWLAKLDPKSMVHASFETGAALTKGLLESHHGKKILLLGSGTFEPYSFGATHKGAQITAVDLSRKSLTKAKWRCRLRAVTNVQFVQSDIVDFAQKTNERFDYIHSFGVLHHLPEPAEGFRALSKLLKPEGFARVMVYEKISRERTQDIQKLGRLLGFADQTRQNISEFKDVILNLPKGHPMKVSFMTNPEGLNPAGFVDAFLHAQESSFDLNSLKKILAQVELKISDWDFSQTHLDFLAAAPREIGTTIEDKIQFCEALSQWAGPFTFWLTKNEYIQDKPNLFMTNPLAKNLKVGLFYSVLLRRNIPISFLQRQLLTALSAKPKSLKALAHDQNLPEAAIESALHNLVASRLILRVEPKVVES